MAFAARIQRNRYSGGAVEEEVSNGRAKWEEEAAAAVANLLQVLRG